MNRFLERFGTQHPLMCAGMGMVSTPALVAAVSAAGGLGVLGCGPAPEPWLRATIGEVRARTDRPFGVNLIHERTAFGPLTTDAHIDACIEERVTLVVFFWQLPERAWTERLCAARIPFLLTVGATQAVPEALGCGAAGLVLQGIEAGGHVMSRTPLAELVPAVRAAHPDTLLIAAGGIADAADVRAALALGADAVCLGTRFVACCEADAHPHYQSRIVAATASDTVLTTRFGPEWPGAPMRVIRNRAVAAGDSDENVGETVLFGRPYAMPPRSAVLPGRDTQGDFDRMCLAAGTSVGRITRVLPAAEIVAELFPGVGA